LAAPIQSSREKRHEAEEIDRERSAAREAQAREHQAVADLRRSRRQRRTLTAVATVAIVLALAALYETRKVQQAEKESELLATKLLTEVIWPAPSGLTWMRRDNGDDLDQAAAARYCQNLRYGGNSDWRLPRVPELVALVKTQKKSDRREVSLSGDIWTETHLGPEEASEALVLSWNGHWAGRTIGQAGGGALCVRGSSLPSNPSSVAALPDFAFFRIPAGNFEMGCSPGDKECTEDEKPRHPVAITRPFEMNKNLVTQAAWDDVIGSSHFAEDEADLPAVNVNWFDAQVFLIVLNDRGDGYHYRLPTEAEWEYAARAGTTGARYGRLGKIAWYYDISGRDLLPHPVRQKDPNPWGFYDILGDAWEWVQDWFDKGYYSHSLSADPEGAPLGQHRVIRGGSWNTHAEDVRVSKRMEGNWIVNVGFRCVREMSPGGQRR
jgi:formylglycine-generating enzyme required for sulfatase activity